MIKETAIEILESQGKTYERYLFKQAYNYLNNLEMKKLILKRDDKILNLLDNSFNILNKKI